MGSGTTFQGLEGIINQDILLRQYVFSAQKGCRWSPSQKVPFWNTARHYAQLPGSPAVHFLAGVSSDSPPEQLFRARLGRLHPSSTSCWPQTFAAGSDKVCERSAIGRGSVTTTERKAHKRGRTPRCSDENGKRRLGAHSRAQCSHR